MKNKTVIEDYKEWELVAKNIMWVKEKKWQVNIEREIFYSDTAQGALSKARAYIDVYLTAPTNITSDK